MGNDVEPGTNDILIGFLGASAAYFNGDIDEVSIWNKELNQSEITELNNGGTPTDLSTHSAESDLTSWWRMGDEATWDGSNWTVPDQKGIKDGTSVNMEEADRVADVPN